MKFEDARKKSCSCIYCLEFPNGMKYVGKTKDLGKRMRLYESFNGYCGLMRDAIEMFGWGSIDISILREVRCSDRIDLELCLSILEIKYIRDLGTLVPNGYNVSIGGECLGIPAECITTDSEVISRFNGGSKALLLYDECGNFVREYPSIAKCAYDNGWEDDNVRRAIGRNTLFYGKYFLRFKRYDYAPIKIELPKGYEVRERVRYKTVTETRIVEKELTKFRYAKALKYDMNGVFCGEFDSKSAACRTFLKNSKCGWAEYRNGYILFKKVSDGYPKQIEDYTILSKKQLKDYYVPAEELEDIPQTKKSELSFNCSTESKSTLCVDGKYTNIKHQFPVTQLTLGGDVIATFDSIRDASRETGIAYSLIYNCLKGRAKKAAGYKWRIEGDAEF